MTAVATMLIKRSLLGQTQHLMRPACFQLDEGLECCLTPLCCSCACQAHSADVQHVQLTELGSLQAVAVDACVRGPASRPLIGLQIVHHRTCSQPPILPFFHKLSTKACSLESFLVVAERTQWRRTPREGSVVLPDAWLAILRCGYLQVVVEGGKGRRLCQYHQPLRAVVQATCDEQRSIVADPLLQ